MLFARKSFHHEIHKHILRRAIFYIDPLIIPFSTWSLIKWSSTRFELNCDSFCIGSARSGHVQNMPYMIEPTIPDKAWDRHPHHWLTSQDTLLALTASTPDLNPTFHIVWVLDRCSRFGRWKLHHWNSSWSSSQKVLQFTEVLHFEFRTQLCLYIHNILSVLAGNEQIVHPKRNVEAMFGISVKTGVGSWSDEANFNQECMNLLVLNPSCQLQAIKCS